MLPENRHLNLSSCAIYPKEYPNLRSLIPEFLFAITINDLGPPRRVASYFPFRPWCSSPQSYVLSIIASEKASSTSKGDHFASTGSNDRIWNSFSKHGLADPSSFISYYSNPWL